MQFAKSSALLFWGLLVSFWLCAQQGSADNQSDLLKPIEIIPPSPNAGSLGKFGGIDFGLNSGSMATSIPLLTYSSRNLKVPVSLSYASNGFKVDEISSRAGVSWNLNAGGVITRTVYGGIDEYSQRVSPPAFSPLTRNLIDNFLKGVSYSNSTGGLDAQPDKFSFNFCGYSGQFILDENLKPVLVTKSNLLVENNLLNGELNFKITTPDGANYYFGATETTSRYNSGQTCGHNIPDFTPTDCHMLRTIMAFTTENIAIHR